jgi:hypothetical protein
MTGRRSFLLLLMSPSEERGQFAEALEEHDGTWLCCRK